MADTYISISTGRRSVGTGLTNQPTEARAPRHRRPPPDISLAPAPHQQHSSTHRPVRHHCPPAPPSLPSSSHSIRLIPLYLQQQLAQSPLSACFPLPTALRNLPTTSTAHGLLDGVAWSIDLNARLIEELLLHQILPQPSQILLFPLAPT